MFDIQYVLWAVAHPVGASLIAAALLAFVGVVLWHDHRRRHVT